MNRRDVIKSAASVLAFPASVFSFSDKPKREEKQKAKWVVTNVSGEFFTRPHSSWIKDTFEPGFMLKTFDISCYTKRPDSIIENISKQQCRHIGNSFSLPREAKQEVAKTVFSLTGGGVDFFFYNEVQAILTSIHVWKEEVEHRFHIKSHNNTIIGPCMFMNGKGEWVEVFGADGAPVFPKGDESFQPWIGA